MVKKVSLLGTVGTYVLTYIPYYVDRSSSKIDRAGKASSSCVRSARVTIWAYLSPSGNRFGGKNLRTRRENL